MPETQKLIHEILPVGMLQCNCHIVGDPESREAIVIDPGDDADRILELIERHHLKVTAIAVTHTHIDHVVELRRVHEATGAPVYIHADDLDLYRMLDVQATWLGWKTPEVTKIDQLVREGDVIRWGRHQAQILHTPGHTPGSICLYMPVGYAGRTRGRDRREIRPARNRPIICRGHAIRRKHRPHRPLGRFVQRNHKFNKRKITRAPRRHYRLPGTR